ncbi:MAG: alpha/beta fold hydrolase [Yaniella sp.]|uniref:alpha/beta hydrolase n=2 Tax=Yaniella sp. TaxID=2773929 RepID=UPI002647485A|nr:alpha/beta fold hydrolase [Yaniella sp.]MDN5730894.1 alpha/beta fold hydrolase [Yaniella sp.]MDN5817580.1 alpha/beta fold hydrolase [Yaniella sp.]MDN5911088.1 alpha/beta fold hydrolase [Yaniella sp.]MDN6147610.1 alpha/beta fold hydrolase [Yaniella sp.]MDN6150381.1 alpha/beta fold hydrolase [Yaniella sp.]
MSAIVGKRHLGSILFARVIMLEVMGMQQSSIYLEPDPLGILNHDGIRWAVLLLHGFTAGPDSVLPWGQALSKAGATVRIPLLTGHGTNVADLARTKAGRWRTDVQQELDTLLAGPYDAVAVGGLSMGGALALDAAAHRPVNATFVVNPALSFKVSDRLGVFLSPLVHRLVPTVGPLAGDVNKPGVSESAYDRTPVPAVQQLAQLFRTTRSNLSRIDSPVTLYVSRTDHIVPRSSARFLERHLDPDLFDKLVLENSYHVATLDHDAEMIHHDSVAKLSAMSGGHREP